MTNQQHPIIPPQELVQQWVDEIYGQTECDDARDEHIAIQAARWGADQELEACCEWVQGYAECGDSLRNARRPKPPLGQPFAAAATAAATAEDDEPGLGLNSPWSW